MAKNECPYRAHSNNTQTTPKSTILKLKPVRLTISTRPRSHIYLPWSTQTQHNQPHSNLYTPITATVLVTTIPTASHSQIWYAQTQHNTIWSNLICRDMNIVYFITIKREHDEFVKSELLILDERNIWMISIISNVSEWMILFVKNSTNISGWW